MTKLHLEEIEVDLSLFGYQVERLINATVPSFIVNYFHDNECGCIARREWLNDKHFAFRMWRLGRAESNYTKAKAKLEHLKTLWL